MPDFGNYTRDPRVPVLKTLPRVKVFENSASMTTDSWCRLPNVTSFLVFAPGKTRILSMVLFLVVIFFILRFGQVGHEQLDDSYRLVEKGKKFYTRYFPFYSLGAVTV
jgi:hypothetical protein